MLSGGRPLAMILSGDCDDADGDGDGDSVSDGNGDSVGAGAHVGGLPVMACVIQLLSCLQGRRCACGVEGPSPPASQGRPGDGVAKPSRVSRGHPLRSSGLVAKRGWGRTRLRSHRRPRRARRCGGRCGLVVSLSEAAP